MRKAKKFLLNSLLLAVSTLVLRGIGVAFSVYISAQIGTEGMGLFQLILSVYFFAVTVATSGIGLTSTRLVSEELACGCSSGVIAAVKKCLMYSLFCSLLASSLLFLGGDFVAEVWLHGKISTMPIYALCVSLPFWSVSCVFSGYFTAVRRIVKNVSAQVLDQAVRIVVTLAALTLLLPRGLDGACLALVLGGVAAELISCFYLMVLYFFDKRHYKADARPRKDLSKRLLHIAVPVALSSYIRSGLASYKQMMIPLGLEKSGISCELSIAQYGMIRGMVMPVIMFPSALLSSFSSLLIPEITECHVQKREARIRYILSRIFKVTLLFSVCISGILFAYAEDLSLILYKSTETAYFIRAFSPLIVVMYLDDIVDAILKGLNEQVCVVGINILDTVISIVLLYSILPLQGIRGYVYVLFICELFNAFLSIYRLIKVTGFRFQLFWWLVLPALSMTASVLAAKKLATVNIAFSILFAVALYGTILYATGGISKKDFVL